MFPRQRIPVKQILRCLLLVVTIVFPPVMPTCCWAAEPASVPTTVIGEDSAITPVGSWLVAGMFPSPDLPDPDPAGPKRAGYETDFLTPIGGEAAARPVPGTKVPLPDGSVVEFVPHAWEGEYVALTDPFGRPRNVCAYIYCELESPVERDVFLHVGTNDCGKVWLGGEVAIAHPGDQPARRSQEIVRVHLKQGRTPLLLKVDQAGAGWGAFVEVYSANAHRDYVATNFPSQFILEPEDYLPTPGQTVEIKIANWITPVEACPVVWEVVDRGVKQALRGDTPRVEYTPDVGPNRIVRLRAAAPHPVEGSVTGECVLLVGGSDAARETLEDFESVSHGMEDPLALTGVRRDAYALALYGLEKLERESPDRNLDTITPRMGESLTLMRRGLDALSQGRSPYEGKTGEFEAAYLSGIDGTAQPFLLCVPTSFAQDKTYALLVLLHGAGATHERRRGNWWYSPADGPYKEETIGVSVMGRGPFSGYKGLGEDDILETISWMKSHYPIDPNRVYIRGSSMGGFGTWRIAARHPDLFAAAMADCGGPEITTLPNLFNLPVYVNHGDSDWDVPVVNSRLGVDLMERMGSPVVYNEYADVGHDVELEVCPRGYMTRLANHTRVTDPSHVRLSATHPNHATGYWCSIRQWVDPHAPATIDARIVSGKVINVILTNVAKATLNPPAPYLNTGEDIIWMVGGKRLITSRSADGSYDLLMDGDVPTIQPHAGEALSATRPYVAGSFMELYQGEPPLIVYGTQTEDEELAKAIREMADRMAGNESPEGPMEFGRLPMVADKELTEEQLAAKNLFLVCGPNENSVTARLTSRMPVREESGRLRVFDSESIPLDGCGYGFVYPNPEHPQRLLFVFSSSVPDFYKFSDWREGKHNGGARMFCLSEFEPNIPDVVVERIDTHNANPFVRLCWMTHDWRPKPASDERPLQRPKSKLEYDEMTGQVFRELGRAAYAIVDGATAGIPCPYEPGSAKSEEVLYLIGSYDLITFEASGRDLLDLAKEENPPWWRFSPHPTEENIDSEKVYRVATSMDHLWGLADAEYNPGNVKLISDRRLLDEVERKVWGVGTSVEE